MLISTGSAEEMEKRRTQRLALPGVVETTNLEREFARDIHESEKAVFTDEQLRRNPGTAILELVTKRSLKLSGPRA